MQTEIVISGFGGQGVLFAGQMLAYAAMDAGLNVTWIPSYGPEMRGGTAHCTVIISEEEIGSPLVRNPAVVMALNSPSLDKYETLVEHEGLLIVNTSLITRTVTRPDVHVVNVPANAIADELGNPKLMNLVLIGALLAATHVLSLEAVKTSLAAHLPVRHRHLLESNYQALQRGYDLAQAVPA